MSGKLLPRGYDEIDLVKMTINGNQLKFDGWLSRYSHKFIVTEK